VGLGKKQKKGKVPRIFHATCSKFLGDALHQGILPGYLEKYKTLVLEANIFYSKY